MSCFHRYPNSIATFGVGGGGGGAGLFLWEAYGIFKFTTAFYSYFLSRLTFVLICV